jgi:hypothetical protein
MVTDVSERYAAAFYPEDGWCSPTPLASPGGNSNLRKSPSYDDCSAGQEMYLFLCRPALYNPRHLTLKCAS